MSKREISTVLFIFVITAGFGQYSRTWTQEAPSTANRFKLLNENSDPSNNYLEEHNYKLFGPFYNHVTSVLFWNNEWYIKNEEGFNIDAGVSFHIMRAGINETAFAHGATTQNVDGYRTYMDHPDLNGNPDAIIVYSHMNTGVAGNDMITGVEYIDDDDQWTIYNQDLSTSIPLGSEYFIVIPNQSSLSFIHTTNIFTTASSYSIITHPDLNSNPNAKLFVSHNLTKSNNVFEKNIGVFYHPQLERWTIIALDGSDMPNGIAFNVMIPDGDLDDIPDYADHCPGYDDAIDRDHDGDPDYCESSSEPSEYCDDATKTIYEDHLAGEILYYRAQFSITSDRKINSTAQVTFRSETHILNEGFEVALGATFGAYRDYCYSSGS